MKPLLKIFFVMFLGVGLIVPPSVFAEESPEDPLPEDTTAVITEEHAPEVQASDALDTSLSPQTTVSGQESSVTNTLETTFDPHDTLVEDPLNDALVPEDNVPIALDHFDNGSSSVVAELDGDPNASSSGIIGDIDQGNSSSTDPASSTDPMDTLVIEVQIETTSTIPIVGNTNITDESITPLSNIQPPPPPVIVPHEEPESKFVFRVTRGSIAAKKEAFRKRNAREKNESSDSQQMGANASSSMVVNSAQQQEENVNTLPALVPDDARGALGISGSCTDKYFVVLVYANEDDYKENPASYIFNKAFDCVGGHYSYSLKDFPGTLSDGTYYILIGGENDTDSWRPISALIPVDIQRSRP